MQDIQIKNFIQTRSNPVLVIVGPTASGKTGLGIKLAKEYNGEIINGDSRQVYRYMDIGTAKPMKEEMQGIKHYLIDIVTPDKGFSVVDFQEHATSAIEKIQSLNKLPIIVGGTGLYIEALMYGYEPPMESDPKLREEYKRLAINEGNEKLHMLLKQKDPFAAEKIHMNNTHHLIRALEVAERSGNSKFISPKKSPPDFDFYVINIERDRDQLYARINQRVVSMFENGIVEETQKLLDMGYTKDLSSMTSIGYGEIIEMFEGVRSKEEIIGLIQQKTRNYAKRQITWWKRHDNLHTISF